MARQNNTDLKDVWQTPPELLQNITENIDLDPCAGKGTNIGDTNFEENGLKRPWFGTVFVNPPFTLKEEFLEKAAMESDWGSVDTVYVVTPDSTDTKSWWHEYIAEEADYIWFSEGRISYIDPDTGKQGKSPTFGTAVSIFGDAPDETLQRFNQSGHLVQSYEP